MPVWRALQHRSETHGPDRRVSIRLADARQRRAVQVPAVVIEVKIEGDISGWLVAAADVEVPSRIDVIAHAACGYAEPATRAEIDARCLCMRRADQHSTESQGDAGKGVNHFHVTTAAL